ncbi:MAG: metal-dependent hydrolase, partial [Candidatus Aenigmarchaeota archaeon]|nr:metal-dependent hydrolase [Candidatus Aenigmarchaeota archaeon]
MPSYMTHILFGVVLSLAFAFLNDNIIHLNINLLLLVVIVIVYSTLPDIDISSSKARKAVNVLGISIIIAGTLLNQKVMVLSTAFVLLVVQFLRHRKFIHSIRAMLIFSAPLLLVD